MLQIIHDKVKGIVATVIVALIVAAFTFVGFNEIFFSGGSQVAAKVNGKKIEWQTVLMFAERIARERGVSARDPQVLEEVRNTLVQHEALVDGLRRQGFRVSDAQIAKVLATIPNFQDEKGQFSKEKYLAMLQNFGYQDASFRAELAQNLLLMQAEQGVLLTSFGLAQELNQAIAVIEQTRDLAYTTLSRKQATAKFKAAPEAVKAHYDAYPSRYVQPEQVSLQYVELSLNQLSDGLQASEPELKNFYLENQGFYNTPEMRRVRHILFSTEGRDAEAQAKQKSKAEQVLAELKEGAQFDALAQKWSEDEETREKGGDLGWFGRGDMDHAFEDASFALHTPNEVSAVVKTPYGYHIIQLLEQKMETTRSFAEVRQSVLEQFRRQKTQMVFEEKKEQLAALAFENPDSLETIKSIMGLNVYETAPFDREGHGAEKWAEYPEFLKTAFSPELLTEKRNSAPINLTPERTVVVRLKKHQPAEQQTFEQVQLKVKADYEFEQVSKQLQATAQEVMKTIREKAGIQEVTKSHRLDWTHKDRVSRMEQKIDRAVVEKAFQLPRPSEGTMSVDAFELPASGDYLVVWVKQVYPGSADQISDQTKTTYQKNLTDTFGQLEFALFAKQLLRNARIDVKPLPASLQQTSE